jgi:hypothetical protein
VTGVSASADTALRHGVMWQPSRCHLCRVAAIGSFQEYKVLTQAQKQGPDRALMTLHNPAEKNILDAQQVERTKSLIDLMGKGKLQ